MTKKDLNRLAERLRREFHRQQWDHSGKPSEINRQAWRNCAQSVLDECVQIYLKVPKKKKQGKTVERKRIRGNVFR